MTDLVTRLYNDTPTYALCVDAGAEIQKLRAELAAMREQKPVAWIVDGGKHNARLLSVYEYELDLWVPKIMCKPIYAAPGAQPATERVYDALPGGKV